MQPPPSKRRFRTHMKPMMLGGVLLLGAGGSQLAPISPEAAFAFGEGLAGWGFTAPLLAVVQAILFTFALPGSAILWMAAPFYPPALSTAILVAGSVTGAAGAYHFAQRMSVDQRGRVLESRAGRLLAERSDFLTQVALRVLPGFPHWVVSYGAGLLGLARGPFLLAALLGLTIKWAVLSVAVHGLVRADGLAGALTPATLAPLAVLAVLAVTGAWLRRRLAPTPEVRAQGT